MKHENLYYMAPFHTALAISLNGIVSRNRVEANEALRGLAGSIADPDVNARRALRMVAGRSLHDFVPLYWAVKTPMQYVITVHPRRIDPDQLVIFELDADAVLAIPGIWTTDGNAAAHATQIIEGPKGASLVDWPVVTGDARYPPWYSMEWKRRKAAEVLVPDAVPMTLLRRACLRSHAVAEAFRGAVAMLVRALKEAHLPRPQLAPVEACPQLFF